MIINRNEKYYDKRLNKLFSRLKFFNIKKVNSAIIFGAGVTGKYLIKQLKKNKIRVINIVDNDSKLWGKKIDKINIISLSQLKKKYTSEPVFIASVIHESDIFNQLIENGYQYIYPLSYANYLYPNIFNYRKYNKMYQSLFFPNSKKNILKVYKLLKDSESRRIFSSIIDFRLRHYFSIKTDLIYSNKTQYFDCQIIQPNKNEIFVDGGGYYGDTVKSFINQNKNSYSKIYSFEPDAKNFNKLESIVNKINNKKIVALKLGLYKETGKVSFYQQGNINSRINKDNQSLLISGHVLQSGKKDTVNLPVISLDNFFEDKEPPTFIKMDIEGAEIDALLGANKLIKKYKPKLAISVYHKPTDLWKIPLIIHKLNQKYKLYLRHYSHELCETVCYAV